MGQPFTPSVEVFKKGDGRPPSVHKLSKERSGEVRGGGWATEPHRTLRNASAWVESRSPSLRRGLRRQEAFLAARDGRANDAEWQSVGARMDE